MNKLDIKVGDKFGEWTVIDVDRFSKHGHTYVQCKCSCGNIKDIASTALKRGKTSKCKKCAARSKTTQLQVGLSIKDWTILEGPVYINSTAYYKVQCKCGKVSYKLPLELLDSNKYFCCIYAISLHPTPSSGSEENIPDLFCLKFMQFLKILSEMFKKSN